MVRRLVILSGSPRTSSKSIRIAHHLEARLHEIAETDVRLISMQDQGFPPIKTVWKDETDVPPSTLPLFQAMDQAHGFIVVSPEYNGGYSPALKNFLDHFPKSAYHRKAWGIVTGSTGAMGGMRASQQMQLLGVALSALVSPRMLITPQMDRKFDPSGVLLDDSFEAQIEGFLQEFLWLNDRLTVG